MQETLYIVNISLPISLATPLRSNMNDTTSVLEKSEEMYAQLIDLYPSDDRFLRKYAEILEKLHRPVQAEKNYEKLHALLLHKGKVTDARNLEKRYPHFSGELDLNDSQDHPGFLSFLDTSLLNKIILGLKRRKLKQGEYLYHYQGDTDTMYIIISGSFSAILPAIGTQKTVLLNLLKRGDIVGEMAILLNNKRSADVIANNPCEVFELNKKSIQSLMQKHPNIKPTIMNEAIIRHRVNQISRNHILARLPLKERIALAKSAQEKQCKHATRIAEGGVLITKVALLTEGVADLVYETSRGESHTLHDFQVGDMFGIMAILRDSSYPADIRAVTNVRFLEMPLNILKDLSASYAWMRLQLDQLENSTMTSSAAAMIDHTKQIRKLP